VWGFAGGWGGHLLDECPRGGEEVRDVDLGREHEGVEPRPAPEGVEVVAVVEFDAKRFDGDLCNLPRSWTLIG